MTIVPLLPIFHRLNKSFFDETLTCNQKPILKIRWSDNKLKTTAGFYKRKKINGMLSAEIVLSKPILSKLENTKVQSTLCHEMIHAWVDLILKVNEIHGTNFVNKMNEINRLQDDFIVSIKHNFPVLRKELKVRGICKYCGEIYLYRKRVKNIACKKCCNLYFNGVWNSKCLIVFDY